MRNKTNGFMYLFLALYTVITYFLTYGAYGGTKSVYVWIALTVIYLVMSERYFGIIEWFYDQVYFARHRRERRRRYETFREDVKGGRKRSFVNAAKRVIK